MSTETRSIHVRLSPCARWTALTQDGRARAAMAVKGPIKKVVEYLGYPRLSRCRRERVVSVFEYNVPERTLWLLPDGLENEQIGRQDRAISCSLCDEQRHHALSHVVQRCTVDLECFPIHVPRRAAPPSVVRGLKRSDAVEGALETGPRSTI